MKQTRLSYWDNWKGLAIIAVVAAHATGSAFQFPEGSFNFNFGLGLRQVINFAVAMFFAMAGYFSAAANESPLAYYQKRIWRVLLPYIFWTAVYLLLKTPAVLPDANEIVSAYIMGTGIGIGYFVIVLLQFVLMTPLLLKIRQLKTHVFVIVMLTLLGQVFIYYFRTQQPESAFAQFPVSNLFFIAWYPFYHFGLVAARYRHCLHLERIKPAIVIACLAVALFCSFAEGFWWVKNGFYKFGASQLQLSTFVYSFLLFVLAIILAGRQSWLCTTGVLTWLGRNSYPVYLLHLIFLSLARDVPGIGYVEDFQPFYILLTTFMATAGCAIFIVFFRGVFPDRFAKAILG